jgi:PEP-CTERM motif
MTLRTGTWVALLALALMSAPLHAGTLTEDFNAPFPAWESGWLASNSNLTNVYGVGAGRGNNPDGLWVGESDIIFHSAFAATLTSLNIDVAGYVSTNIQIYDDTGAILLDVPVNLTNGAFSNPGVYAHYSATSSNGIGGFRFTGGGIVGNTSIDNVVVTDGAVGSAPEPGTLALLGSGLVLCAASVRRRRKV